MDKLNEDSIVYSFGVGKDISFDLALIQKYGCKIHAFDPTPESIKWVQKQNFPPEFTLYNYGISSGDSLVSFYPPKNPAHISHTILNVAERNGKKTISVYVKRLSTIMKELGHCKVDLIKMDIEGAEYSVIEDMKKNDFISLYLNLSSGNLKVGDVSYVDQKDSDMVSLINQNSFKVSKNDAEDV